MLLIVFELIKTTPLGRRGRILTSHGAIETPFFMPVGTAGAMKGITHDDLISIGAQMLLCNTYHLHLRPGEKVIKKAGGLHEFIGWEKPILTDSGGFQVYSLSRLRKISEEGVSFNSHIDGRELFLGPSSAIAIQHDLGSDIIMCFDECPPSKSSKTDIIKAVDRTLKWARTCKEEHEKKIRMNEKNKKIKRIKRMLFCVVQGGLHYDLRKKCAEELITIGFDGYALGGLAVGESEEEMFGVVDEITPLLPSDKPRYLMGVGEINQMKYCISKGIDMFDCVLPMRIARHGTILMSDGGSIRILNSKYVSDHSPIDIASPSRFSRVLKKSYLNHLLRSGERLGETYAQMQNMAVTLKVMQEIRLKLET